MITLLITVFNRHKYIERMIEYYQDMNVIFVDSSDTPYDYPEGINYILCKDKLLYESLYEALSNVDTKYVCWNNDDDIVLKSFLTESVTFLEENDDYSNTIGLQVKPNSGYGFREYFYWRENNYKSDNPCERIKYMMNYFHTPAHVVTKTEILKESCMIPISDESMYPIKYFDRILGIVQAYHGNKKALPMISLLRREDRMIGSSNYPKRLKQEVDQITLESKLKEDNSLNKMLKEGLNDVEINSINFNNYIGPKNITSTRGFNISNNILGMFENSSEYEETKKYFNI